MIHHRLGKMVLAGGCLVALATVAIAKPGSREAGQARIEERTRFLQAHLATFTLELRPQNALVEKPYYTVLLQCGSVTIDRDNPFFLQVQVSTNTANRLVDHLARSGFLAGAEDGSDAERTVKPAGDTYRLTVGSRGEPATFYRMSLGWNLDMVGDIEAIRSVVAGEAAAVEALNFLLTRLSGWQTQWEKERTAPAPAAAKKEPKADEVIRADVPTVSLDSTGHNLTAVKEGRTIWMTRLPQPGQKIYVMGDRVHVEPGRMVFDLATGKLISIGP